MIASLVAPILWLGALERFSRWQTNRNPPAGGALLTAVALALMVTIDTPVSIEALGRLGLSEYEVVTVERVLLLVACYGALVFAFALDGRLSRARLMVWSPPLVLVGVVIVTGAVLGRTGDPTGFGFGGDFGLAVETALVYTCLGATALVVAVSTWRVSKRSRVHRAQLRLLALGGVLLAIVAVANVIAGGVLLQQLQVGVWVLRLNRFMLDAAFASWTLVLMASWATSILISSREWLHFRPAYEQVKDLFPDLEAVVRQGGGWVETAEARAVVVLDGWAMLASPGDGRLADASPTDRAEAVARWLDRDAPYGSVHAVDLEPPSGWRTSRWTAAVTKRAQHTPSPLLERVR
ncbi:Uncharacterised protein (plasmid) [Tsukamurella tyrosinosolvens]|uniref:Uncharacterized protein n=1 Tax=Tsukamurella tyrosinosolvens TaxID=57704 RepID=A0A1H4I8G9_TSUTY|nr:hypothetical protein [Tsukamurella tyrosinosolvens]KXO98863.1 hypothetical protein AXK58_24670 [Tsukamurella tyrosinosolvens]MEC4614451.1 hypothetical protein [Tsukamurella tyrosinosolvens]QRY85264.1 hypothetical protein JVY00_03990 [Tsukamurella tyrosinosolvens]RDB48595.1 hypothetical protein DVB87_07195 [Tsukamurella tyrosinosolvens]SEB30271.1 hypothetical protein SAMN04489793_0097 [Tsukamurella tyrosinosolvens]